MQRQILCSQTYIIKIVNLVKWISKQNSIPVKISAGFFAGNDKLFLKFMWKCKRPGLAKTILIKNKVGGLSLLNFKIIKLQLSRHRYIARRADISNIHGLKLRIQNKILIYSQFIFNKGTKAVYWGKKYSVLKLWWYHWMHVHLSTSQKDKPRPLLHITHKN